MKINKFKYVFTLLAILAVISSCVEDDDFNVPDTTIVEPTIEGNIITVDAVAGFFAQAQTNGDATFTFEETNNVMSGYVISSDEGGNFFEEIIFQDKLENPTAGIKVLINVNPLFTRYELGRKVFIKLDGLSVGLDSGVLTLGVVNGTEIDKIPAPLEEEFIQRSAEKGELVPLPISLGSIDDSMTNLFVTIEDAQFHRSEVLIANPLTFAAEPLDEFDGERTLESCEGGSIVFSSSTFADFKGLQLPTQRGSINGILTKNFFGDEFNFVVNSPADIHFDNAERCDPIEIDCGLASAQGTQNIFMDDFESQTDNVLVNGNGWTNFIEAGTEGWEAFTQSGTNASLGRSARVGSFRSDDVSTVAWLITPAINLDAQEGETFMFKTSNSFSDGSEMELLFSPDWDGTEANITSANWGVLPAAYIVQDGDFFGTWFDSGIVDLSCGTGTIHIAFKYTGSGDAAFDGTYELDDISIDSN
jgi:hypothetical protein